MFKARRRLSWPLYVLSGIAVTFVVGLIAAGRLAGPGGANHGGGAGLIASYIAGAAALAAAVAALLAPRRPYLVGLLTGFVAPTVAGLYVFRATYDPAWWPLVLAAAAAIGVIGSFVGVICRWLIRRDSHAAQSGP